MALFSNRAKYKQQSHTHILPRDVASIGGGGANWHQRKPWVVGTEHALTTCELPCSLLEWWLCQACVRTSKCSKYNFLRARGGALDRHHHRLQGSCASRFSKDILVRLMTVQVATPGLAVMYLLCLELQMHSQHAVPGLSIFLGSRTRSTTRSQLRRVQIKTNRACLPRFMESLLACRQAIQQHLYVPASKPAQRCGYCKREFS